MEQLIIGVLSGAGAGFLLQGILGLSDEDTHLAKNFIIIGLILIIILLLMLLNLEF